MLRFTAGKLYIEGLSHALRRRIPAGRVVMRYGILYYSILHYSVFDYSILCYSTSRYSV